MKKVFQIVILLTIILGFSNCRKSDSGLLYDKKYIEEIRLARKEAGFYMARDFIPGATFAIAKDGKLIYSEGLGLASKDLDVPVNRNTKFRIGEISEIITSLAYHLLVENGTLHSDSAVQHYLPDFPEKEHKLTLDNLSNHSSGIRIPSNDEVNWKGLNVSIERGLEMFKDDPLISYPGWDDENSPFSYNLLGAVIEKAKGERFHKIIKELVTDTLNLLNTGIDNPLITIKGRSDFYDNGFMLHVENADFIDLRYRAPSQGFLSNAEDLAKLGNAMLYSDYISEDVKERIFTPVFLQSGFPVQLSNGWVVSEDQSGRKYYARSGHVTGGGASLLIFPDEKLVKAGTINITGNTDGIPLFKMAVPFLTVPESQNNND